MLTKLCDKSPYKPKMLSNNTYQPLKGKIVKCLSLAMLILFLHFPSQAQLIVDTSYSVQTLIQNVLLGSGVYASNITFKGEKLALGYFNGQNTNLGIDSGIVFSTGDVTKIQTSASTFISTSNNTTGDTDLESLVTTSKSYDAAIIEFDFYTFSNSVSFKYVFGSEEYPNFACDPKYNDVFGFFINGPGIVGKQNLALIPGTNMPVSISNVYGGDPNCPAVNAQYYVDNAGISGPTIALNGFTTVLEANCSILPCQTYHIKLAVADFYDKTFDSGVFLEARSFNSGISITSSPSIKTLLPDSAFYEGCGYSTLYFAKSDTLSSASTYYLSFSGSAINGLDYVSLPDSIVFSPGQDTVSLIFTPLNDGSNEVTETVNISVNGGSCASNLGSLNLSISDHSPITLNSSNDTILQCPSDGISLMVNASGGAIPFSYSWNSGDTDSAIYGSATESSLFIVNVTDICGFIESDSINVIISNYTQLKVSLPNDTNLCAYESTWLKANVNGGKGQYTFAWEGMPLTEDSVLAAPDDIATFIVFVTDSCGITASDTMNVSALVFVPSFSYNFESNFEVSFTNITAGAIVLEWDFGTGDFVALKENTIYTFSEPGEYEVRMIVQNQLGCIDTINQLIIVNPEFNAFIPNTFSPNNDQLNDEFFAVTTACQQYQMQIHDRWGTLLFYSDKQDITWDGKSMNGQTCPIGTYSYSFQFVDLNGKSYSRMGSISIIN
jgi:gliding motility-associated-like protein